MELWNSRIWLAWVWWRGRGRSHPIFNWEISVRATAESSWSRRRKLMKAGRWTWCHVGLFFFFKMAETKLLRWIEKIQENKRWETEDIRKRKEQFIEQVSWNSRNGWDSEHLDGKGYTFSVVTEEEEGMDSWIGNFVFLVGERWRSSNLMISIFHFWQLLMERWKMGLKRTVHKFKIVTMEKV